MLRWGWLGGGLRACVCGAVAWAAMGVLSPRGLESPPYGTCPGPLAREEEKSRGLLARKKTGVAVIYTLWPAAKPEAQAHWKL